VLKDCRIGDGARVISSFVDGAEIGEGISVGPFSRIRPGTKIEPGAYIGNFAEIKNSNIGPGSHVGHFSYVGDTDIGKEVNIGAGTVTANFDGRNKHRTVIGDGAFVGSDSVIVAPVSIGEGAHTGAGSVVNRDVPPGETVVGVPAKPIAQWKAQGGGPKDDIGRPG
jgi:bifunctional UDP-N-acetylglucosamine pyrophosphorylase/glucosamine-1-phosphate N-acetyltransferase